MANIGLPVTPLQTPSNLQNLIRILRVFIDDLDETKYTDQELTDVLSLASMQVNIELCNCSSVDKPDFCYCIDAPNYDPCVYSLFANLVALQAACILNHGEGRQLTRNSGIQAECGPISIKIETTPASLKRLLTGGPCEDYLVLKEEVCSGYNQEIIDACAQVCSVFTSSNYLTEGWCETCCRNTTQCKC